MPEFIKILIKSLELPAIVFLEEGKGVSGARAHHAGAAPAYSFGKQEREGKIL